MDWSVESDTEAGVAMAAGIWRFWEIRGFLTEARDYAARLLAAIPDGPPSWHRAKAFNIHGIFAFNLGDYAAARSSYEQSLSQMREIGDTKGMASVLGNLGNIAFVACDYETARARFQESYNIHVRNGDRWGQSVTLGNLGTLASSLGDHAAGRRYFEQCLEMQRELGAKNGIAMMLANLGYTAWRQGDTEQAPILLGESLELRREIGDRWGVANSLEMIGQRACGLGELAAALECFQESITIQHEIGDRRGLVRSLEGLAMTLTGLGKGVPAACLLGFTERLREEIRLSMSPHDRRWHEKASSAALRILGEEAFAAARKEGREMPLDRAVGAALDAAALAAAERAEAGGL
jgi:tetratricopeptide (TPR) repeat protein